MWFNESSKDKKYIVSSRVRFARNIEDYPFPCCLDTKSAEELINKVKSALPDYNYTDMSKISKAEIVSLFEKHLISKEFAEKKAPHALLTKDDVAVMVCEEDHIRLQCIKNGDALDEAYAEAVKADDIISVSVKYSYNDELGYLTECPTNLGTGMRASVMMFLPALGAAGRINALSAELEKFGLTIRGFLGENSESAGSLFQISNQLTLGMSEEDAIRKIKETVKQIAAEEGKAEQAALKANRDGLTDAVMRSKGLLLYSHRMSFDEFLRHYSNVRLGLILGLCDGIGIDKLDSMLFEVMPATLSLKSGKPLAEAPERDLLRAAFLREALA